MSIFKYFSIILVGLAATVSQAEIAITVPPPDEQLERPSAPSDAIPSEVELKVEPLRLALDLVDGSHIIGVPSIKSVPFQTSYAKIDIPLEKIVSIKIKDDHETTSFELQNGDTLTGILNLKPMELETIFGRVSIGTEHVRALRVIKDGFNSLASGVYTIQQKSNGRYLDAHESRQDYSVVTRTAQNNASQQWTITPSGDDTYTIQQKSNGRYLDAHESGHDYSVVTRTAQKDDTQQWVIDRL
jgi:hypothetical protein